MEMATRGWSPYVKDKYEPLKAGSIDGTDVIPHDNAVVRALSAVYIPPEERTVQSNPTHTLFVGRLNLKTSEQQLCMEFSQYGQVKSCRLVKDIVTGISRGYGFVEFRKEADAQKAWRAAHGSAFHERQILVEWEFSRTMPGWIPRRLGGGLGGRKESGQLRFGGRDRPFKKPFILPPEPNVPASKFDSEAPLKYFNDSRESKEAASSGEKLSYGKNDYAKRSYSNHYPKDTKRNYRKDLTENYSDYGDNYDNDRWYQSHNSDESFRGFRGKRKFMQDKESDYDHQSYHEGDPRKYRKTYEDSNSRYEDHKKVDHRYRGEKNSESSFSEEYRRSRNIETVEHKSRYAEGNAKLRDEGYRKFSDGTSRLHGHHTKFYSDHHSQGMEYKEGKERYDRHNHDSFEFEVETTKSRDKEKNLGSPEKSRKKKKHKRRYSSSSSESDEAGAKRKKKKKKHKKDSRNNDSDNSEFSNESKGRKKHKKKKTKSKRSRSSDRGEGC